MDQQEKGFTPSYKDGFNALFILARAHATTLTVFLRSGFGSEALGWPGLWAFLLLLLAAGCDTAMGCYLVVWIVALVYRRLETLSSKEERHSLDEGRSLVVTRTLEPSLCFFVGIGLGIVAQVWEVPHLLSLAGWIFLGTFSLGFQHAISEAIIKRRVQAMHDARLEQEEMMRRYEKLQ